MKILSVMVDTAIVQNVGQKLMNSIPIVRIAERNWSGMSYKSLIEIVYGDLKTRIEENAYNIVQSYGINVDKAELLKALEYDREQYEQGYADGQRDERTAKVDIVKEPNVYKCHECGQYFHKTSWGAPVKYCSRCGKKLEWE